MRTILRKAYDGDYQTCIRLLVEKIESQNNVIVTQNKILSELNRRIERLEKSDARTKKLVVDPLLEEMTEETSLSSMLEESRQNETK